GRAGAAGRAGGARATGGAWAAGGGGGGGRGAQEGGERDERGEREEEAPRGGVVGHVVCVLRAPLTHSAVAIPPLRGALSASSRCSDHV
ncbi:MAG: hypothetical protein FJ138_18590, partial [Deltaproteobacteria bacterium]|nr:hypothetical protein [Deltaproteobacteria bacterium]